MTNWTLVTEAAPRAGMVANQRRLLEEDATAVAEQIEELTIIEFVLLAVGLAIGVVVVVLSNRAIAEPVIALRAAVEQVRAGSAAGILSLDKRDEIGALARALDEFCDESVAATRIKAALDRCQANVMVADADCNIVYLNEILKHTLRAAQDDIRTELPQFDVDQLIGANIDSFHKNPTHQRGMLASLSGAYKTEIKVGGR